MKRFDALLFTVLLMGCQNSGSPSDGVKRDGPVPPQPKTELQWGDLNCQKNRTCRDPVLDKRWVDLVNFFELNFEKPLLKGSQDIPELLVYRCGIKTHKQWVEFFHVPPGSTEEMAISQSRFFDNLLEFESCTYKDDLDSKLKEYFKNTKEYQNEIK